MAYDLFQSRRGYNEKCAWWNKEQGDDYESDEIIMKRVPEGYFMAKQENPFSQRENSIYNTYLLDKSTVTIKTPDNVEGIQQGSIVLFRNEKWIVVSFQTIQSKVQQSEFACDTNRSHYTFIELRK